MNVQNDINQFGPLEPLLSDPGVIEILVDGHSKVYVERHGAPFNKFEDVPTPFRDDNHLMEVIRTILEPLGCKVDESSPLVDARLFDDSRVNVIIPPISLSGPVLTIRKFPYKLLTVEDLIRFGSWTEDIVEFLRACVCGRINVAVAGGTGSGKTTVLNNIAGMIPDDERRIICIQNAAEFRLPQKYVVSLESRPPNLEGKGEVTMRDLVINALRMRPDRLVVGEVRGDEALDLLQAMNVGHDGSLCTIHANSPREVLSRLEVMVTMGNPSIPLLNVRAMIASAINLIVQIKRLRDGRRKIVKVTEVQGMQGDAIALQDIFEFRQTSLEEGKVVGHFTATGQVPKFMSRIRERGIDLRMELFAPRQL